MQVLFKSRDRHAVALRALAGVNGPRGGIDKRCQPERKTDGAGGAVVTSVAGNWRTALDRELAHAARFPMRLRRRGHDARRLGEHPIALERCRHLSCHHRSCLPSRFGFGNSDE